MDLHELEVGCTLHSNQDSRYSVPAVQQEKMTTTGNEKSNERDESYRDGESDHSVAWLHATVHYTPVSPPDPKASATGQPLNAFVTPGDLDIGVSGGPFSTAVRPSTDKYETIRVSIPMGRELYQVVPGDDQDTRPILDIDPSAMVLTVCNVNALTTSATLCQAHGAFGSTRIADALKKGSTLINLTFGTWSQMQASVALTDLEVHSGKDPKSTRLRWRETISNAMLQSLDGMSDTQISETLVKYAIEANQRRTGPLKFAPLVGLTKPYVDVPVLGYAGVESILHTPTGLCANELDGLLGSMFSIIFEQDGSKMKQMIYETKTPPLIGKPSMWREVAARALHLAIRFSTEYRADGAVVNKPNGANQFFDAESWLTHTSRSFFRESNDCDGSAMLAMRLARQIGLSPYGDTRYRTEDGAFISLDPEYEEEKHVWTRAVRNALGHTDTLTLCVVGASTGEGKKVTHDKDSSGPGNGPNDNATLAPPLAGHAVPLFIPTSMLLQALATGDTIESESMEGAKAVESTVATARVAALFPTGKLRAANAGLTAQQCDDARVGLAQPSSFIAPLAIDGTVTSQMDLHVDEGDEKTHRISTARLAMHAMRRVGPTVADRAVDLTCLAHDGTHGFYRSFVEMTVPGPLGDDPVIAGAGRAASQYVFVSMDKHEKGWMSKEGTFDTGASPATLSNGAFALLPLARLDHDGARAMGALRRMVQFHTIPARGRDVVSTTEFEISYAQRSVDALNSLGDELRVRGEMLNADKQPESSEEWAVSGSEPSFIEYYLTPRALWGNPNGVAHFISRIKQVAKRGEVDIIDLQHTESFAIAAVVSIEV